MEFPEILQYARVVFSKLDSDAIKNEISRLTIAYNLGRSHIHVLLIEKHIAEYYQNSDLTIFETLLMVGNDFFINLLDYRNHLIYSEFIKYVELEDLLWLYLSDFGYTNLIGFQYFGASESFCRYCSEINPSLENILPILKNAIISDFAEFIEYIAGVLPFEFVEIEIGLAFGYRINSETWCALGKISDKVKIKFTDLDDPNLAFYIKKFARNFLITDRENIRRCIQYPGSDIFYSNLQFLQKLSDQSVRFNDRFVYSESLVIEALKKFHNNQISRIEISRLLMNVFPPPNISGFVPDFMILFQWPEYWRLGRNNIPTVNKFRIKVAREYAKELLKRFKFDGLIGFYNICQISEIPVDLFSDEFTVYANTLIGKKIKIPKKADISQKIFKLAKQLMMILPQHQ